MKLSNIIYNEEYLFSLADGDLEVSGISTDPCRVQDGDLLIIPNSDKNSEQ